MGGVPRCILGLTQEQGEGDKKHELVNGGVDAHEFIYLFFSIS